VGDALTVFTTRWSVDTWTGRRGGGHVGENAHPAWAGMCHDDEKLVTIADAVLRGSRRNGR
jgi:hypothetical protein